MIYLGDFRTSSVVYGMYATTDQSGASISPTTDGTIRLYKANGTQATFETQRSSQSGISLWADFDTADLGDGVQVFKIDTSDNTDSGFYAAGNDYFVILDTAVVDSQTISIPVAHFSIENRTVNADRIASDETAATNLAAGANAIIVATLTGTPSTTTLASTSELQGNYADDMFNGRYAYITSGTYAGQATLISDYVDSTGTLTVATLANAPAASDTIIIA